MGSLVSRVESPDVKIPSTGGCRCDKRLMRVGKGGRVLNALKSWAWRQWYEFFAQHTLRRGGQFSCMNWGYSDDAPEINDHLQSPDSTSGFGRRDNAPNAGARTCSSLITSSGTIPARRDGCKQRQRQSFSDTSITDSPWYQERYSLQLYRRLVRDVDLSGKDVVEVSSGRGGGLAYLTETFEVRSSVGIDYARKNIVFCHERWHHLAPRLRCAFGRAERLPLPAACADVVLSVEASHCYADLAAFIKEVFRVLRPGGIFLWTDFARADALEGRRRLLQAGFKRLEDADITEHVLAAMAKDRKRRVAIIQNHTSRILHPFLTLFAAADDRVRTVTNFKTGHWRYFLYRAVRC